MYRLSVLLLLAIVQPAAGQNVSGQYDSADTQRVIERMVEVHGGYDAFIQASSVEFTVAMYLAALPAGGGDGRTWHNNWRYYTVTIEPTTSRGTVVLPQEGKSPVVGNDGSLLWAGSYLEGFPYRDEPFLLQYLHYGTVMMPFLTQHAQARFRYDGRETLPGYAAEYHRITMSYADGPVENPAEFTLWIDPETYVLRASAGSGMFPVFPGLRMTEYPRDGYPGMIRMLEAYHEADGLLFPRSYTTVRLTETGEWEVLGSHLLLAPSVGRLFDAAKTRQPTDTEVVVTF